MKKILVSFCLLLSLVSIFSCAEDSVQQKLESEKVDRVAYVKKVGGFTQSTTGLYYNHIQEGTGEVLLDQAIEQRKVGKYIKVALYMAFYRLNGEVITDNYLSGYYEPLEYTYLYSNIKPGLSEALGMMKVGGKMRTVMSTSLYGTGEPRIGIEPMMTREYESVICDIELKEITMTTDKDLE
jgi:FKBP-type peptidyl-prolyl cis-trans isomerase